MKKLLLTLLLLFSLGLAAKAVTYTVTASSGTTDATFTLTPSDGLLLTAKKNNGSSNPTYVASGKDARIYAKGTATIKAAADQKITKIVFNISTQGKKRLAPITASVGTIATQAKGDATVTWTGDASEISFTVGDKGEYGSDTNKDGSPKAGQFCFSTFEVTSESTGNPDDTRETFNFEGFKPYTIPAREIAEYNPALPEKKPTNITYESSNEDIAYADNSGILAGDVAGKATITASWRDDAVFKDGSATFEVTVVEKVNSIAEMLEKAPNKDDKVYVNFPMTVTYVCGQYGYVTDGKGGFTLIYGNYNLADKDIIPAGWTAVNSLFNGLEEYTVDGSLPAITEKGTAYEPRTITLAEVTKDLMNEIVIIKDVTFASATPERTSDNYAANFDGKNGSTTLQFRTNFPIESVEAGKYDVLIAVGYYNGTIQAYPIEYIKKTATSVEFGQASVLLAEGATATQQATVTPKGVSVTYSSSDETVATVDAETGEVTAVAAGTAEITATVAADKIHEGSTASYSVTVVAEGDVNKLEGEITWGEIKRSLYGWLTIPYSFKLINYDGAEIAISMQVVDAQGNELPGLTYSQANTPRQAEAAEVTIGLEGEKMVKGTMLAAGTALGTKDNPNSDNLKVRVNATVSGTALQDENTEIESAGNTATGIEDVTVEGEGEAEYFNLQGLRVAQPEAGQLYIRRQGGKAVKVRF